MRYLRQSRNNNSDTGYKKYFFPSKTTELISCQFEMMFTLDLSWSTFLHNVLWLCQRISFGPKIQ